MCAEITISNCIIRKHKIAFAPLLQCKKDFAAVFACFRAKNCFKRQCVVFWTGLLKKAELWEICQEIENLFQATGKNSKAERVLRVHMLLFEYGRFPENGKLFTKRKGSRLQRNFFPKQLRQKSHEALEKVR